MYLMRLENTFVCVFDDERSASFLTDRKVDKSKAIKSSVE